MLAEGLPESIIRQFQGCGNMRTWKYIFISTIRFMPGRFISRTVYRRGKEEFTVFMQENHFFDRHGLLDAGGPETDFVTGPGDPQDRVPVIVSSGRRAEKNVSERILPAAGAFPEAG